ncbi:hypothetical protein L2E82_18885 [Cichorium intybus]|uniref:Uncharacterized protein n=1 Tax=Cichorium intybus TaxID=13427 RepID=A0ACB9FCF8_CICIN|nr:hypothetical protein L2E82_18885 [Cichorium intybus]
MVKDEGWIDEVGDEASNSEEGSSLYPSEEEEEEWSDDLSVNNSVDSKSEEEVWMKGDRPVDDEEAWMEGIRPVEVVEECQQSVMPGLGGTRPNENIDAVSKEKHEWCDKEEDSGHVVNRNSPCAVTSILGKCGNDDTCVGKGVKKDVIQICRSHEGVCGLVGDKAQSVDPLGCGKSPNSENIPPGIKKGEAHVDYSTNGYTGAVSNGAKILDKSKQNNIETETEEYRTKKLTNLKVGCQEKEVTQGEGVMPSAAKVNGPK